MTGSRWEEYRTISQAIRIITANLKVLRLLAPRETPEKRVELTAALVRIRKRTRRLLGRGGERRRSDTTDVIHAIVQEVNANLKALRSLAMHDGVERRAALFAALDRTRKKTDRLVFGRL